MTSFVCTKYPENHPGVQRAEAVIEAARQMRRGFDSTRSLAAMLLAAVVAALLVVADQVIDTWADGHLMMAWMVLWTVAFAAIGLFAGTARSVSGRVVRALDAWAARVAQARADERLWSIALTDARVMSDLQAALARDDGESVRPAAVAAMARAQRAADARRPLPSVPV